MIKDQIQQLAKKYAPEFIEIRHQIHANPELSYQEFETSAFVQQKLSEFGIPFEVKATTGVVGLIKGKNPDTKITALRADMDALPIPEENDVPYKSKNSGVMHACGHDVHTTCLLGAAKILNELKEEWEGTVKLIFQPGEEKNPGGASILIKEGVLENPKPSSIFALHVHPGVEVGRLSFRGGMIMASADEIYITIKAKGGHAAAPQYTADTILIASHLIVSLQQIVSRNNSPFNPSVLSITSFQGGTTTNVIPSEVKLMGTFRAMNEEWRDEAHRRMIKIAESIAEGMGAKCEFTIVRGFPFLVNEEKLTERVIQYASEYLGEKNVVEEDIWMAAEDFSYYSQAADSCFYLCGVGNPSKGINSGLHTATFNIDEDVLKVSTGLMAYIAVKRLGN